MSPLLVGVLNAGVKLQEFGFLSGYVECEQFLEASAFAVTVNAYEARWFEFRKHLLPTSHAFDAVQSARLYGAMLLE